jgi:hypothetical protein
MRYRARGSLDRHAGYDLIITGGRGLLVQW